VYGQDVLPEIVPLWPNLPAVKSEFVHLSCGLDFQFSGYCELPNLVYDSDAIWTFVAFLCIWGAKEGRRSKGVVIVIIAFWRVVLVMICFLNSQHVELKIKGSQVRARRKIMCVRKRDCISKELP
jgi:hypothetical protein